ncbi:class I SAM-dependent methyltransferase [Aromatoleum toluclasticum]|uniref:class I SAM-dependent methyltransferase n=1 Tax=Aromatoleum toluclasticum TaxID=92003 RepID=UPI001D1931EE|nr:class I SAM-dependent methyltransferase [Aromatoleum toluclasticum]MCC4115581.1 class I SAM-dependent methyltransferase [Aromatoleum toluclasticum]
MPPALKALFAQIAGWACAFLFAGAGWLPAGIWPLAGMQALGATAAAAAMRSARWWLAIHAAFAPLLVVAERAGIAPAWYLAAFALLLVVYWTSFRTQVPLYLSNRATIAALAGLLPAGRPVHMLDLGSGTGSLLRGLVRLRPDCRCDGVEAAPAPWLLSRLLARTTAQIVVRRGDFFTASWEPYDLVYAFLSPVPMARVWAKAQQELTPGALVVSNSFPIPGRIPDRVVEVDDRRATRLYVYRVADGQASK